MGNQFSTSLTLILIGSLFFWYANLGNACGLRSDIKDVKTQEESHMFSYQKKY